MIKIRYRDANELSPGLHATAECHGRTITIYLLSGLTAEDRKAALRRLRLSGLMGYGPRLPAVQLAFALFVDRIRTTIAQAGSVFRTHPAGTTGPVMLISGGAIAFLLLSAVSIHILREPRGPDRSSASGPAPAASAIAVRIPGPSQRLADGPAGSEGQVLTTAQIGSGTLPVPASPDLPGTGSGIGPDTGSTGSKSTGSASTGSESVTGTGSTSTGTASASIGSGTGGGGVTAGSGAGSKPDPAPSTSVSASAPVPVAAPRPVSASVAPSVSVSASVSASNLVTVSASVPASIYTSDPVTVSGSASAAASPGPAPSPSLTAGAAGGACLDAGSFGVCLDG